MLAAKFGHIDTVVTLLNVKGIDVNATDVHGMTALMWAVGNGHTNTVIAMIAMDNGNLDLDVKTTTYLQVGNPQEPVSIPSGADAQKIAELTENDDIKGAIDAKLDSKKAIDANNPAKKQVLNNTVQEPMSYRKLKKDG